MKKPTHTTFYATVLVFLLSLPVLAQNFVPFTPRFNQAVSGDIVLIGNNTLGQDENPFNSDETNNNVFMRHIDIDDDDTTFSSTSADLAIPNPNCFEIIHAGLYWSAVNAGTSPINQVRLMGPTGGYNDISGIVIFDANSADPNTGNNGNSVDGGNSFPYACYADITNVIRNLGTTLGTYTVANVSSAEGRTSDFGNGTGHSAGWSLFIVYEDPTITGRRITSFDGFSAISVAGGNPVLNVPVSGFTTIPVGPVRANFAFAALEGDRGISGDRLSLNGQNLSAPNRPFFNFFNSSVSQLNGLPAARTPNSLNTLGFDTGVITVPNPSNVVIANGATSANVNLTTSRDTYFPYFYALSVDIIEPNIVLTKIVEDTSGNDIEGTLVDLGDELNYVIGFQNTGNDDATNFTIRDVLPVNIQFDIDNDIEFLPPGVTVQSYDVATRELIFAVDNDVVEVGDVAQAIRFRVRVVSDCSLLTNACSNIVENQAFSTYQGTLNTEFTITDDPSFSTNTGCLIVPSSTNFLTDLDCTFTEEVTLCGDTTVLTAADGFDSYSWSTSPTGTPVIATTQSITVDETRTYFSFNTAEAPCQSTTQEFNVTLFGSNDQDPLLQFADQIVICPDDGDELTNIFLCGSEDSRFFQTNITDTSSIIWELLDETSCDAVLNPNCANTSPTCVWNQVETGPNYLVDTAGQYRLTLNYPGGCFEQFYFNVFENLLTPTATARDIICSTPGEIVVGGVPNDYEYSIDGVNYQPSNTFSVTVPGIYTVSTRQLNVSPNPCIFTVPNVQIRERDVAINTNVIQPLCNDDLGSVRVALLDAEPQYTFSIAQNSNVINTVGPLVANNFTFENLAEGTYTVTVTSEDGCLETEDVEIIAPPLLQATSALTTPLTCEDGEITITATGGTPPYFYFVNNASTFQNENTFAIPIAGTYTVRVVDFNNCEVETTIDVDAIAPPDFTVAITNILCADQPNSGRLDINVSNANGNTIRYSIDNGTTFQTAPSFTSLTAGDYQVVVEYTTGSQICFTDAQTETISTVPQLTADVALTTPYSCLGNGEITVSNAQNGTPPYEYSIDGINFQSTTTFSNLVDGDYTIIIRDANLCSITDIIVIAPLDPPTDLEFANTALSCPELTTDISITATTGGRGDLEYRIIAPAGAATGFQTSTVFEDLNPDTYTFEVRDEDNCTYTEIFDVQPLPALSIVGTTVSEISCFGETDGAIRFTVSGTNNFTYTINGGASIPGTPVIDITNLAEGNYTIIATDIDTNCTETATATIAPAPARLTATNVPTPITCATDGSVTITANGGVGGYTYELVQPDGTPLGGATNTNNTFTGLTQAGNYTATVRDANGCDETTTFSLAAPLNPTAALDAATDVCFDPANGGATIAVTASGGNPPYQYSINGGAFDANSTFTNLAPNTYTVVVRDSFGCTADAPISVTVAPQLTIDASVTDGLDCTTSPEAEITGTIGGGTAPFTFDVNINGSGFTGTPIAVTGNTFVYTTPTANPDSYQFLITDANGCTVESSVITVPPIEVPTVTIVDINPLCNDDDGDANGSIEFTPAGGEPPYTIVFNGSAPSSIFSYTGLVEGNYDYTITDANSCFVTGRITLTEPAAIAATVNTTPFSCDASNANVAGSVTINTPTGGTPPYQFSFNGSGFSANNVLTVNDNGADQTINWQVRDANGCITAGSETLNALNPPVITSITNAPPVTCTTTASDVTVNTTGGVAPLSFEITAPSSAVTTNATGMFTGLTPDTYVFRVTDANGCFVTQSHTVAPVTPIEVIGQLTSNVLCEGESTGSIRYTVSGVSSGGFTISNFSPAAGTTVQTGNTINITGLPAGTYTLEVTDNTTGCIDDDTITISEPATPLSASASSTAVFCTTQDTQITITATGGTPNYRYAAVLQTDPAPAISDYVTSNVITRNTSNGANLDWQVYVLDANDCSFEFPITITNNGAPTVTTPPVVSNQCTATSNFTFEAQGSGGLAPLEYSIDGVSFQSSPIFTVNTAGTFIVTVRDANGCTATSPTNTEVFSPLNANAVLTKDLTCSVPTDASIEVTTFGGSNDFTVEQSFNGGPFTTLSTSFAGGTFPVTTGNAGTYVFRITDNRTDIPCTVDTNTVTVTPTAVVDVTEASVDPTCNGFNDGSITLTPTSGEAPFEYSINDGLTFVSSNVFGGLVAATYTYQVRDARGCTVRDFITLTDPAPIDVTLTSTGIVCNVNTLGSFTATINSGGVADFTYTLFDRNSNQIATSGPTSATSHTFPGLTFGDYIITIVDANGCEYNSGLQRIDTPPIIGVTSTVNSNTCSAGVDIEVTVSGGQPPYRFSIFGQTQSAPQASNTFVFTGLLHNTTFFLQVQDANNCIGVIEETTPPAPSTIEITGTSTTDVTCNGADNGSLTFTVDNFDPSVTDIDYEILDQLTLNPVVPAIDGTISGPAGGPTPPTTVSGIPSGSYVLQVREATGTECPASFSFTISQPIQAVTASVTANIPANCNAGAQVTVTATGGTPPYRYAADVTSGFPAGSATFSTSNVLELNPITGLNWEILVEDANGCPFRLPVTISRTAMPTIDPVPQECYTGAPFNITLSGTVDASAGPAMYSLGGAFQASPVFTINGPDTYTATIQDTNGCTATNTFIIEPQIFLTTAVQDLTCIADASITLTASGGSGTYGGFEVSFNGGAFSAATSPFTTSVAGNYQFRVSDDQATNPAGGCQALSNIVTITPNTTPTLTEVSTDVTCNGDSDGTITITAANGQPPYEYSIDGGGTFVGTNTFTGLAVNTYNVQVRDARSCPSASTVVNINEPSAVTGTVTPATLTCGPGNATQSATISVSAGGGTGTYTYSFDNGVSFTPDNTFTTSTAGTINIFIMDSNGCTSGLITETIAPLNPPSDLSFSATTVNCTATTSDVTLTAIDGVGTLTYAILAPASATSNTSGAGTGVFTALAPDTYLFEVTDANSCTYQEAFTIDPVTNVTVSGQLINGVTCNNDSGTLVDDGAVTFNVGDFTGTYTYTLSGTRTLGPISQSASTIPLTGLPEGNVNISITDDITNCTATATVFVPEPTEVVLTLVDTVNGNCEDDARIEVAASGGTPGYTFAFVEQGTVPVASDFTTNTFAFVDPGVNTNWDVHVRDINGCTATVLPVPVQDDPLPTITLPEFAANQCNTTGDEYTFSIVASTGQGTLTYALNGNAFGAATTFTVAVPSVATTHRVTVMDENGCTAFDEIEVLPPLTVTAEIQELPSCNEGDGEITVTGAGGTNTPTNYTYTIVAPASATANTTGVNDGVFTGLDSGNYTFEITDANTIPGLSNCSTQVVINLPAATPVTFTAPSIEPVRCFGESNGRITVNLEPLPSNDNPIYQYEITAGTPTQGRPAITRPQQNSNIFENLPAGEYTIRVTSGRSCTEDQIVTITEPTELTVSGAATPFACNPDNSVSTAILTVTEGAATGTSPYRYSIDGVNFVPDNEFPIADTGSTQTITVSVRDGNGCIATNTVIVNPLPTITAVTAVEATPIDCNGTGSVQINVTGGSGSFSFEQLPSSGAQASNTFAITEPGTYFFRVNDLTTGCFETTEFTVQPFDTGRATLTATTAVTCFDDGLGAIALNIENYTGAYTYQFLDNNSTPFGPVTNANTNTNNPEEITGLSGGRYQVQVVQLESPFCTTVSNVETIDSPTAALALTLTETANVTCDNNRGAITAEATGGEAPYTYQLISTVPSVPSVPFGSTSTFTDLAAGTYTVEVRDNRGCIESATLNLTLPPPIVATIVHTPLLNCFNDTNGTITVTSTSGGQGENYTYTLNQLSPNVASSGPQTDVEFNNLSAGTYNVTVTDGLNCTFTTADVTISEPQPVQSTLILGRTETCINSAEIIVSASGGTPPYNYTIITLEDTDNNITTPDEEVPTAFTGIIALSGGQESIPVQSGDYLARVVDSNDCSLNLSNQVTIPVFTPLTVAIDARNATILCTGDTSGAIIAEATGGLGDYTYTLLDAQGNAVPSAIQNSPGVFTDLQAGTYSVFVESGIDCTVASQQVTITEPPLALSATADTTPVVCAGDDDGSVEIIATGGTGIIKYAISPRLDQFVEDPIFENLAPGTYQAVAQDENGCFMTLDFTITTPDPITLTVVENSIIPELCSGDENGAFSVQVAGGVPPYSVSLDSNEETDFEAGTPIQTQFDFENLAGGNHTVYIRDANRCIVDFEIDFPLSVDITPSVVVSYGCEANLSTNIVTVELLEASTTNPADVEYALDGGAFQPGNMFFNVAPGLDHFVDVRHVNGCVRRTELFDIDNIEPLTLNLEEGRINEIIANASGGTGNYQFSFEGEPEGNENSFFISESGTFTVVVTDSNGCTVSASIPLEFIDICIPNIFNPSIQEGFGPGCADQFENLELDIFDRYGRRIASIDINSTWDGTYNGSELPTGDYWYIVKLNDENDDREFVGHFTLYR